MRSVKEYVEVSYLGEIKTVPVYQYVCYVSSYDVDAVELHELYKQRSTSETWIEQVKGHTMAGSTLTDDFWANDILQQFRGLAVNLKGSSSRLPQNRQTCNTLNPFPFLLSR